MRRVALIVAVTLTPFVALAHAAERGLIMLLPTGYYLTGGALAVAISFLVLAFSQGTWLTRFGRLGTARRFWAPWIGGVFRWTAFLIFTGLIIAGLTGVGDPLANPLPLAVWTIWWIGFTLMVAAAGDLWPWLNPWSAPLRLLRTALGPPPLTLPEWVAHWPAVISILAFTWFEIVSLAPDDPARLARAVLIYWLIHLVAMILFGEKVWRPRCEAFSLFFQLLGRLAPITLTPSPKRGLTLHLHLPGAALIHGAALPFSGWMFVIATISGVTFDGLSATFWWLGQIGVNPLEFPGRSAVMIENSSGLIGVWAGMGLTYALSVWAGWSMAGRTANLRTSLGRLALSLLPIALAYHGAHYLPVLLVNGQYALVAATDPLGTGADWLGLGQWPVTTSFLNDLQEVERIWRIQTGVIVGGHLLAVLIAHAIALEIYNNPKAATLSQIPLAALMVGYTVLGLWLLSTPTGA